MQENKIQPARTKKQATEATCADTGFNKHVIVSIERTKVSLERTKIMIKEV